MSELRVTCPSCGENTPVPDVMNRYKWKSDTYSRARNRWFCWNCGESFDVEVRRAIVEAKVVK